MSWGTVLNIIGTGISAWSSWNQSQSASEAASDQAEYLQEVAAANSEISLMDAEAAEKDAAAAETAYGWRLRRHLKKVDQMVGSARAGYAKSGVAIEGSALDTIVDIARSGAEDAALIAAEGKTAGERGRQIADRYRSLAAAGLKDAAYQSSMIEQAAADQALYGTLSAGAQVISGIYEYGDSEGWWE